MKNIHRPNNVTVIICENETPPFLIMHSIILLATTGMVSNVHVKTLFEDGVFQRGWVTLSADFMWKGTSLTNLGWCQKTRVNTLSRGIKILAVGSSFRHRALV